MADQLKPGRPRVADDLAKASYVKIYCSEADHRELRRRAAQARLSLSSYLLALALRESVEQRAA